MSLICGGVWIVRNHQGDAVFHARDMFMPVINCIAAELRGILWVLDSLSALHWTTLRSVPTVMLLFQLFLILQTGQDIFPILIGFIG